METKVVIGKEATVTHISQEREMFSILWLFLSVLRQNDKAVCFDSLHHSCRVTLSDAGVL